MHIPFEFDMFYVHKGVYSTAFTHQTQLEVSLLV